MRKTLQKMAIITALTAAALFTAACGGAGSSSRFTQTSAAMNSAAGSYDSEVYEEIGYPEEAVQEAGAAANSPNLPEDITPAEAPAGRKLIRNVDMDVETDSFDALISGVTSRISELGGYVEQSSTSGRRANHQNNPIPRSAFITARIPSARLDLFITTVEDAGNVIAKTETTEDVTLQYSDIESRKKSLTIEQDRIWELLEKADSLEAVITLEERLSEIRYELESMESQLRLYDNQVDYSTVTLRINEVTIFTPTSPESAGQRISSGFTKNLNRMCDFFVNLFISLAAGSPIWAPAVCFLLLLFYLGRRHEKKRRKNKSGKTHMIGETHISGETQDGTDDIAEDKTTENEARRTWFKKKK